MNLEDLEVFKFWDQCFLRFCEFVLVMAMVISAPLWGPFYIIKKLSEKINA